MTIKISRADCQDHQKALELEWLETNGMGGYASSTILGCNTRKYHGLLVSNLPDSGGKFVLLSKLEDCLVQSDGTVQMLSTHQYPGVMLPNETVLSGFEMGRTPSFKYRAGRVTVLKEIAMVHGEDTVLVKYTVKNNKAGAKLRIRPMMAFRDFHGLSKQNIHLQVRSFPQTNGFKLTPYVGMPSLHCRITGDFEFLPSPDWYRNFEYNQEARRGFEAHEDLFSPGAIEILLKPNSEVYFVASTSEQKISPKTKWQKEMESRRKFSRKLRGSPFEKTLEKAARQFIVSDGNGQKGITAGYPWFVQWGRDAMIAAPGLMFYNGMTDEYFDILKTFAKHERKGVIPNFLGSTSEQDAFNSADASLWFAWATQQFLINGGNQKLVQKDLWPTLVKIFHGYRNGTIHNIRMLENGLLEVGSEHDQVTWMDAKVNGKPVTPRWGCPVEINALWYNFVSLMAKQGSTFDQAVHNEASTLAPKIKDAFNNVFWIEKEGRLGDVYRDGILDETMRPNQVFAVSLPHSPLDTGRCRSVMNKVSQELVTPYGLRTLSPSSQDYKPRYEGGPNQRDNAYHNGTVWPWLLGHFGEGLLKTSENKNQAVAQLEQIIEGFEDQLKVAGLGTISEVFDGDTPQRPGGCTSQAWSVAEILRLSKLVQTEKERS